jgi:hypothetical protein
MFWYLILGMLMYVLQSQPWTKLGVIAVGIVLWLMCFRVIFTI